MNVNPDGLEFFEGDHLYSYDGDHRPSVTQILDPYSGLQWADPDQLAAAAEFGNHVHQACHLWNVGALDYEATCTENAILAEYLNGWIRFCEESNLVPIYSEARVHHERLKYAGTLDVIGRFYHKQRAVLIDIKTGASLPRTVGPQTAAYTEAVGERLPRYCCLLTPNGYSLTPLTDPRDFSIFKAALVLHNWQNGR